MAVGNLYLIAAVAVIGGGLFGFDISSMSAIIGTKSYLCYFHQGPLGYENGEPKCKGPHADVQGGITASMAGGSWLGALVSGFLSDRLGRKTSIMIGSVIWCIGSILVCAAQNIPMLIVGRIINGLSVGICSAQVPVYISEMAPPTKRGRVVGMQQWAITWGILIMFYISYGCSFINGTAAFRIPWGLQMIPAVLLFFGLMILPESPRWLARKDRWEECLAVLTLVHGKGDPNSPFVVREYEEIKQMCEFERENADVSFLELLKPNMLNRTHVGVFIQIWSQMCGMNTMMYYIVWLFAMAGYTGNNLLVSSSVQYILNVVMTVPALLFVDRWGRRPTLVLGAIGMMTCMFANAGLLATYGHPAPEGGLGGVEAQSWLITGAPSKAVIAFTYLFVVSYAISWGPVSWVYPPELFPLRVRGKANALCTSANWAFNFALGYFVPSAFVNIKWQVYIVFGVFCTAMGIHVYLMFPETAGKTLEEVEAIFTNPEGIPYIGTPAWKTKNAFGRSTVLEQTGFDEEKKVAGVEAVHEETAAPKTT
ncbi:sugar transporter [Aspergillus clavatus NRRL 1]|uniref:Probable quinate permease n=1 Tax=Aspergillus clavatus (strain ATCC 1007 / CBS 513.65 / DSM 816 / NCTC 3887 / NRRL 1 / QM 1276 / 107) TaxID=344612 RepID=A1CTR8_ASPCL|nr:sugar transporter [Aspergillus clavatus NRRL 1]EAW06705.1 sugar transporter [Aspergillus clavatus NRRL 1]